MGGGVSSSLATGQAFRRSRDLGRTIGSKGHQIRVAISSSNSPRFDANQNNGHSWPADRNYPAVVAHQTIYLGGADSSAIVFPQIVGPTTP